MTAGPFYILTIISSKNKQKGKEKVVLDYDEM